MGLISVFGLPQRSHLRARAPASRPQVAHRFRPALESLEGREVPSAASVAPQFAAALAAPSVQAPALAITALNVTNVAVTSANSLLANVDLVGSVAGRAFTLQNLQLPVNINLDTSGACPVLHLSLEIEDLNLLGLHVELNNCNAGPITVDINAIPSSMPGGGLLGDVLCGLNDALGSGGLLGLTGTNLSNLTGVVENALNGVFGQLAAAAPATTAQPGGSHQGGGHRCDLVSLHLGPIDLNVLGLEVTTSPICLDIYAVGGSPSMGGGLLGNLLCGLDHLLTTPANGNAISALVTNIIGTLDGLGI